MLMCVARNVQDAKVRAEKLRTRNLMVQDPVHQAETRDHLRRLQCVSQRSQNQVVPILVLSEHKT